MRALRQAWADRDLTDRGPQCLACRERAQKGRHALPALPALATPAAWIDGAPCAPPATAPARSGIARTAGAESHDFRSKRCHRCALHHMIQELRESVDPDAVAKLEPLLRRLEQHSKPRSALTWLERSPRRPDVPQDAPRRDPDLA